MNRPAADEDKRDWGGGLALAVALGGLLLLAAAMGYVSYRAQRLYIAGHKPGQASAVTLEALGLDTGAVVFAALAFAAALRGRSALRARIGNLACVAGSLGMNAMSANFASVGSVAVWVLPALLYAYASDSLVVEVQARVLDRRGQSGEQTTLAGLLGRVARAVGGVLLWLLRLSLAMRSTFEGFRRWVIETAPVAPGRRVASTPLAGHAALASPPPTPRALEDADAQPVPATDSEAATAVAEWAATATARWDATVRPPDPVNGYTLSGRRAANGQPAGRPQQSANGADLSGHGAAAEAAKDRPAERPNATAGPATESATEPDGRAATNRPNRRTRPARKSATKTATKTAERAAKARKLLAANPDMNGAELGRQLKVPERTARRLLRHARAALNGTQDSS